MKALPCPFCSDGIAKIRLRPEPLPYTLGKAPSSFGGQAVHPFVYKCACMSKLSKSLVLTMAEWNALPDIPDESAAPAVFVMPKGHKPGGWQTRKKKAAKK